MTCSQQQQLISFPKVRVHKKWFRYFNDHKTFRNEGTLHLFSLMALYSYANFRTNKRHIGDAWYMEAPGQWICKASALPRILRTHSKIEAMKRMDYFKDAGFLDYEMLEEESGLLRFTISDWSRHCAHLNYNYYSYKGSGFFFFPLPVGRALIAASRKQGDIVFSELDAIMDMWLHTVLNEERVAGSNYMPIVYYANMKGQPLLSYSYLAKRWGWSKSKVGRFMLKIEEAGVVNRVSFSSSRGSVISMCRYREMIFGDDCEKLELQRIGEILGIASTVIEEISAEELEVKIQSRVPQENTFFEAKKAIRIEVSWLEKSSFFARPVPLIFYSSLDWEMHQIEDRDYRGPPERQLTQKGDDENVKQQTQSEQACVLD